MKLLQGHLLSRSKRNIREIPGWNLYPLKPKGSFDYIWVENIAMNTFPMQPKVLDVIICYAMFASARKPFKSFFPMIMVLI